MVLSIDATQDARSQKSAIRPIVLVTINVTKPSAKTYRFSHNYRTFGGDEYLDYLSEMAEASESMNHLDSDANPASFFVQLINGPFASADMLTEFLSVTYENASILVEEILLDTNEARHAPTSTGQITRFKGRIRKLSKIEDQTFVLECTDERMFFEDAIDWRVVEESDPSPQREVNRRLPKPYGENVRVPCVAWDVGAFTTLAEDLTDTTTGVKKFTDVSKFSNSGKVMIGGELISYSGKNDTNNTLTISTRGQAGGSDAVAHKTGESALEEQTNNWFVAGDGADIKSINRVFLKSGNGDLIDVTSVANVSTSNTTLVSGRTVASVKLSKSALQNLKRIDDVIQQPQLAASQQAFEFNDDHKDTVVSTGKIIPITSSAGALPQMTFRTQAETFQFDAYRNFKTFVLNGSQTITKIRLSYTARISSGFSGFLDSLTFTVKIKRSSGATLITNTETESTPTTGKTFVFDSGFVSVSGMTITDLENSASSSAGAQLEITGSASIDSGEPISSATVVWDALNIAIQVENTILPTASFGAGFGEPEVFADVDGFKVPSGDATYSVAAGTLIERDYDIARHILQVQAGVSSADLASDFNTQGALEETNSEHAFVLNSLGTKTSDLLAGLGNESRANIVPEAGKWRFIRRRLSPPGYGSPGVEFSKANVTQPIDISIRPLEEIWNKTRARYDFDPSISGGEDETFKGRATLNDAGSITKFGSRELDPFSFATIKTALVADETLGELLQEQNGRRYTAKLVAPYYDTFKLQLGDIISVLPAFLSTSVNMRMLEIRRNLEDQIARITAIEVSGSLSKTVRAHYGVIGPLSVTVSTLYGVIGLQTVTSTTLYGAIRPDAASWDAASPDWDDGGATWD